MQNLYQGETNIPIICGGNDKCAEPSVLQIIEQLKNKSGSIMFIDDQPDNLIKIKSILDEKGIEAKLVLVNRKDAVFHKSIQDIVDQVVTELGHISDIPENGFIFIDFDRTLMDTDTMKEDWCSRLAKVF